MLASNTGTGLHSIRNERQMGPYVSYYEQTKNPETREEFAKRLEEFKASIQGGDQLFKRREHDHE